MSNTRWTASMIEDRLEEAAFTLRRLPDSRVPGYFNTWPAVVRSVYEAFGYERASMPRIAPTPESIKRMEEAFTWLPWLEPDDARIVWLRAERVRWKPICFRVGLTRQAAWARWVAALVTIANRLNCKYAVGLKRGRRKGVTATIDEARREGVL
jgi:hypothetical protein